MYTFKGCIRYLGKPELLNKGSVRGFPMVPLVILPMVPLVANGTIGLPMVEPGPDPDFRVLGGAQPGEGSRGPPRPLVGPGQSPGRGFRGRSPRLKTIFSILEWLGRLSLALFCKKNHSLQ